MHILRLFMLRAGPQGPRAGTARVVAAGARPPDKQRMPRPKNGYFSEPDVRGMPSNSAFVAICSSKGSQSDTGRRCVKQRVRGWQFSGVTCRRYALVASAPNMQRPASRGRSRARERSAAAAQLLSTSQEPPAIRRTPRRGARTGGSPTSSGIPTGNSRRAALVDPRSASGICEGAMHLQRHGQLTAAVRTQGKFRDELAREPSDGPAARLDGGGDRKGYLGLSRVVDLDDMSVDLSAQLRAKRKPLVGAQPERIPMRAVEGDGAKRFSDPPTTGEFRRWGRGGSYAQRGGSSAADGQTRSEAAALATVAEREEYEAMKRETSAWTTATAAACFALVYAYYTRVRRLGPRHAAHNDARSAAVLVPCASLLAGRVQGLALRRFLWNYLIHGRHVLNAGGRG